MNIKSIKTGIDIPNNIFVIIEIPKNNYIKYEINKNILYVDRFMSSPMPYPFNYGFINKTLSLDNDSLDSLVITNYSLYPKSVILCRPIGILIMEDESGEDNKIISVPDYSISNDYNNIKNIKDIKNEIEKISFFFKNYKKMDKNKWSKVIKYKDINFAKEEIILSIKRYNNNIKNN